ncbi:MAG: TolC family protein [candidate division Zixibacteria bacterium]|nr:TolC family protein [candidate division Zixibacteria bacterium]
MIINWFYKFILFSLIFLVFQIEAKAQKFSGSRILDSLIQVALENNPEILSSKYSFQAAEFKAKSAGTIPDPKFMIAALNMPRSSLSFDETPMSGIALGVSQTLPWPGRSKAQKAVAQLLSKKQQQNILQNENNIIRMVKHFYFEYSYWTKARQILDNNLELIGFLINIAETKYANGTSSAQDALRAQTTAAKLKNKRLSMTQMAQTALLNIGHIIDDPSVVHKTLMANIPENMDNAFPVIESNNPQLTKAKLHTSISDKNLYLAKSGYYPNFTFGLDYRIRKDIPMDALHGEDFVTVKVGFQLPLWFFARQNNQTKSARFAQKAANENYHAVQNNINKKISAVKLLMTRLTESFAQYNNSIMPQAMAAYEAAQVAYEVGEVDFNALLMAQLDLFEIELEQIALLKNYWQKHAELVELSGGNIKVIL